MKRILCVVAVLSLFLCPAAGKESSIEQAVLKSAKDSADHTVYGTAMVP